MRTLYAFVAGFLATLVFHQPVLGLLHFAGLSERAPYAMDPTAPFAIPAVVSLALWGGVWGILLWLLIRKRVGRPSYWLSALLFGAIAPTLVAGLVVAPLKGQPVAGGGDLTVLLVGVAVNAAWGLGTALLMRLVAGRHLAAGTGGTT